ncbi:MAG: diaminopimelate epimerase [Candidatus Cloacimonas sp.]|nr:diaminopimelate epimerase [Candidatus Cloacimonadota bacterium]
MGKRVFRIPYTKMQAQGNNYIYCDFTGHDLPVELDLNKFAIFVSDQNIGIGSDGLVCLFEDKEADVLMRIWNSDGSEAMNCGSALRSITAYLYNRKKIRKDRYRIKTKAGIFESYIADKALSYHTTVVLSGVEKLRSDSQTSKNDESLVDVEGWKGVPVSVGNPHFVLFDKHQNHDCFELPSIDIKSISEKINGAPYFKEGANIEFVAVEDSKRVKARVWELGSGETQACGTGACAIAYAGFTLGILEREVEIVYPGGSVSVVLKVEGSDCHLSGEVRIVSDGEVYYEQDL